MNRTRLPMPLEMGTMLKEHPELELMIEGHTDGVGAAASNQSLSEKRAEAVRQYLVDTYGVETNRLQAKGFWSEQAGVGQRHA
jgi:outer membrane protein OmpA-like peptidoglycan-associated protein